MPAPSAPPKLLIDTNIWVDNYCRDRPGHRRACEVLDLAAARGATILFAVASLKDVYYIINLNLKRMSRAERGRLDENTALSCDEYAFACIENMANLGVAVGADASDVWLACKYRSIHSDFEDNMVMAAAQRAKADFLVTNDEKLLRHAAMAAMDAAGMAAYLRDFQ